MRPYEVMVIFDAGADPSAIQGVVDRALETIRSSGGNPGTVDRWGRRPFAYEVKHRREGYYVLIEFTGRDPDGQRPRPAAVAGRRGHPPQGDPAARQGGRADRRPERPGGVGEPGRLSRAAEKEGNMATDNTVVLVGNVTRDPELRFTNTGQATATFGLAVNRRWQNRQTQEWEEATSFFDVVCWREMAENVSESLAAGRPGHRRRPARAAQLGVPGRATSAPRSRWSPTRSAPRCAGRPPR